MSDQFESEFEANLYSLRRAKLEQIAALGQAAGLTYAAATYPNSFPISHTVPDIRSAFGNATTEELEATHTDVSVAGRLMAIRAQGKAGFAQLQQSGERLQIYVRKDDVGEAAFSLYKLLDLGDHIGVTGFLFRTRTGELSIHVRTITFLAKAMLALPDKYHGLEDTELRYRQRYVDLFMNTGTSARQTEHGPAPAEPSALSSRPEAPGAAAEGPASPTTAPLTLPQPLSSRPEAQSAAAEGPASPATAAEAPPPNVREVFVKRAAILRSIRNFFDTRGYLEVETPMMHTVAGGAAARPFKTHHNALDLDLSLRIAPELFLKRLVVGGMDRVYEINRNFRNEGISTQHNPEFTMLEFYQAYANYHDLMDLTQELVTTVATEVNGTPITHFNGHEIDLSKWTKLSMREAIIKFWPDPITSPNLEDFESLETMGAWLEACSDAYGLGPNDHSSLRGDRFEMSEAERETKKLLFRNGHSLLQQAVDGGVYEINRVGRGEQPLGKAIATIFEVVAEEHLIQPTIIYDFPLAVSPLSKQKPDEPDWVERFEFYIGGFEVGNAFSELNDPVEQRLRFEAQLEQKARGDDEAHAMDEDYVRALGYGLPPTGGEGIGIDRLTMLLTNSRSIRDVILFPLLRPPVRRVDPAAQAQPEPNSETPTKSNP